MSNESPNRVKGLVFGLVGGAVGTLTMNYYWEAVQSITGSDPRKEENKSGPHELDDISLVGKQHKDDESSTAAVARTLDEAITGDEPDDDEKEDLSNKVHWTYGTIVGGLYGLTRGGASAGPGDIPGGLIYGTGLGLVGSELVVPMLGLSAGPTTQTPKAHLYGLGAHLVYGLVLAIVTQVLYQLTERK